MNIIGSVLYLLFSHSEGDTIKRSKKESKKEKCNKENIKQLKRSTDNKIIAGVCGGIGEYLEIDPTIVRIVWIVFTLVSFGLGLIAYLLFWIVMPKAR
jgi:phage shock protein C